MTFDDAFERLIGHEGGLSMKRADPGNWTGGEIGKGQLRGTKYGISAASYPALDIRALTLDAAKAIYRCDYWNPTGCEAVPEALRFDLFDMAVNSGPRAAIRMLQTVVGADPDGILGPRTLQALGSMPVLRAAARFNGERLEKLASLPTWPSFSRGWARRIAANLKAL